MILVIGYLKNTHLDLLLILWIGLIFTKDENEKELDLDIPAKIKRRKDRLDKIQEAKDLQIAKDSFPHICYTGFSILT